MYNHASSELLESIKKAPSFETLYRLQTQLTEIANRPVTETNSNSSTFYNQLNELIYCGQFDQLFGGLVLNKNSSLSSDRNHYSKPLRINILLCRLLFSAERVFYDGEFQKMANKYISQLCDSLVLDINESQGELLSNISRLRQSEQFHNIKALPCVFNKEELVERLIPLEFNLFLAICGTNESTETIFYARKKSLKDAATQINMPLKQAQILEYSIQEKLTSQALTRQCEIIETNTSSDENTNEIICKLIEALADSYSYSPEKNTLSAAFSIFNELEDSTEEVENVLNIICAGINLLGIKFEQTILERIFKYAEILFSLLSNHNNPQDTNLKIKYQKSLLKNFLESLPFYLSQKLSSDLFFENTNYNFPPFHLIFIDGNAVDCNQQVTLLRSKYNLFQKIFIY